MRAALIVIAILSLTACGRLASLGSVGSGSIGSGSIGSGGGPRQQTTAPTRPLIPAHMRQVSVDQRQLAEQILSAEITPGLSGPVLRATAASRFGGSYNAELVLRGRESDQLIFEFRAMGQPDQGAEPRHISAARILTQKELAGVRSIRVVSASNARVLRP